MLEACKVSTLQELRPRNKHGAPKKLPLSESKPVSLEVGIDAEPD